MKKRKCAYCGDEFTPTGTRQMYCNKQHYAICEVCGNEFPINRPFTKTTCSKKCSCIKKYGVENPMRSEVVKEKQKKSLMEHYGVTSPLKSKEIQKKFKETVKEHYGVEHPSRSKECLEARRQKSVEKYGTDNPLQSEEIKDRIRATNIERYGVDNPMKNEDIKKKVVETNQKRYGVSYPMQSEEIREKSKKIVQEKYGVDNVFQLEEVKEKSKETMISKYGKPHIMQVQEVVQHAQESIVETCINKYGVAYPCLTKQCIEAQGNIVSSINRKFKELLDSHNIESELEFSLGKFSYDIKIGNILIEIDPTYTHNSTIAHYVNQNKDIAREYATPIDYHIKKSKNAENNGYRCVHVFDWDNWNKIVDLVSNKSRVYARNTEVKEVSASDTDRFLELYHLQGTCSGQDIRIGLFYNNELVQVMTFGKPRYNSNYEYELLRLCTRSGIYIIGGAEKLLNYFKTNYDPKSIVSYCDRSKFSGDVYSRLGFKYKSTTYPRCHWSKGSKHITNNLLMSIGYDRLFGTNYGKGTDNRELMIANGWREVYDCGQATYTMEINS